MSTRYPLGILSRQIARITFYPQGERQSRITHFRRKEIHFIFWQQLLFSFSNPLMGKQLCPGAGKRLFCVAPAEQLSPQSGYLVCGLPTFRIPRFPSVSSGFSQYNGTSCLSCERSVTHRGFHLQKNVIVMFGPSFISASGIP